MGFSLTDPLKWTISSDHNDPRKSVIDGRGVQRHLRDIEGP